jgi:hypothetical protein
MVELRAQPFTSFREPLAPAFFSYGEPLIRVWRERGEMRNEEDKEGENREERQGKGRERKGEEATLYSSFFFLFVFPFSSFTHTHISY